MTPFELPADPVLELVAHVSALEVLHEPAYSSEAARKDDLPTGCTCGDWRWPCLDREHIDSASTALGRLQQQLRRDALPAIVCTCGHTETAHNIENKRKACSTGTAAGPCPCPDLTPHARQWTERRTVLGTLPAVPSNPDERS